MSSLLTPRDVRDLAERLAVRPTKTLGQNFVHDAGTVRKIVRTAGVEPGHHVLEVGPGLGSLTLALLEAGAYVTAVEIDPVLSAALPRTVSVKMPNARQHLQVVNADALTVTSPEVLPSGPAEVTTPQPTAVVANLPYNVSVPVVLTLLEALAAVETMLVMVQAEVGHRLVAAPGSRTYGIPSAKLAWFASADVVATISRTVFWPVPNVDSVLVRITRRAQPGPTALRDATFSAIDAAFAQRRKMLRAALASWAGSAARAEALLQSAGIDPTKRGETLTIDDYARLGATAIARSQSTASSDH